MAICGTGLAATPQGQTPRPEPWKIAATCSKSRQTEPVSCQPPVRLGRKGAERSGTIGRGTGALLPRLTEIGMMRFQALVAGGIGWRRLK